MLDALATHKLPVPDLAAARDWYTRVLGRPPDFDQPFYVGFDLGGYELGLVPAEGDDQPGCTGATAFWRVVDADAAVAALLAAGATLAEAVHGVGDGIRLGTVIDPFGNRLGVIFHPHFRVPPVTATVVAERPLAAADGALAPVEITAEVEVPISPDEAWRRFMDPDAVQRWLGVPCRIEPRIGGAWEVYFRPDNPAGARGGEGVRILSYLPGRMLSLTWNAPPEHPDTRPRHTWVVFDFTAIDAGCRVRLTHSGWPARGWTPDGRPRVDSPWPATFACFQQAWPLFLGAFAAGCGGG
ncbi:MAG: hypothetical protein D6798_04740 [Deltaproteobacteria bacterium]|nr:MAG: hypothetical protein D6798_04740 [Deltaproteobacteria bacterium]